MAFPASTEYLIIGAGIHGLSTAWHPAEIMRRLGRGSGRDILVVDKSGIAAAFMATTMTYGGGLDD
jgi:glycine/D-amino acid oxidase-like deaminating enzyme